MNKLAIATLALTMGFFVSEAKAIEFDADVPQALQQQVLGDLGFIKTIASSKASVLHKQIYGDVSGAAYDTFFTSRVLRVGYDDQMSGGAVAYVSPMMDSEKMYFTQNYTSFSHPQIARLMVVFHEARHTETKNQFWMHATCPTPFKDDKGNEVKSIWTGLPLAGQPGCDSTALGAYGSSTIMMKNISLFCENCSQKVKMDAGLYSDDQLNRLLPADARNQIRQDVVAATLQ